MISDRLTEINHRNVSFVRLTDPASVAKSVLFDDGSGGEAIYPQALMRCFDDERLSSRKSS